MDEVETNFELLQAKYMIKNNYDNIFDAFSIKWITSSDYDFKSKLLKKAIEENKKIDDIEEYRYFTAAVVDIVNENKSI